ncbi:sensor histidine kinase [Streptomyces sp. NPDC002328]|uniref:sensor histidine kinase n=1 Tax=Streptomyces sp. NPDC002328 TaxID=3364642 RepID=UPI0036B51977
MEVDEANTARTARTARQLWSRLFAEVSWSRRRVAGEIVLTSVLAGLAGLYDGGVAGFGLRTCAVVAGVAVLSLARRALPATVLVLSAAVAGELLAAALLLIYVSWSAGSRIMKPWCLAGAFVAAFVLHATLSLRHEIAAETTLSLPLAGALVAGAFFVQAIVPGMIARYRSQRRQLLDVLQRHNSQLVREQAMVARQARLMERARVAQDMHDSLGHQLALITVHVGALQVDPDLTERQREGVAILREAAVTAMGELREAVGILHEDREDRGRPAERTEHAERAEDFGTKARRMPGAATATSTITGTDSVTGADSDAACQGSRTIASIDGLVKASRAAGATVLLRRSGAVRPLAPAADHAAYRIAQEGLTNAHKHAPGAPITLALRYEPDSLVVEVANGPVPAGAPDAPAAISGGQGLSGLRERARLVGGMVHTGPGADGGFRVAGMLPYDVRGGGAEVEPRPGPDGATSVGHGDDFVGQWGAGAADDSGAVINQADPQGEFAAIMSRKKNVALGCGVTAVVLVVSVIALGVWGVVALMDETKKALISPSLYESAKVGDTEAALRGKLPEGESVLTEGLEAQGPPTPAGATCRHFMSDDPDDVTTVFRFCFRDGALVDKQTFKEGS